MDVQTYLNLNQHNAEAYHLLGRINQAQKNYAQAAAAFKKAKQHGDNSARVQKGIAIASEAQTCVEAHGHLAEDHAFQFTAN